MAFKSEEGQSGGVRLIVLTFISMNISNNMLGHFPAVCFTKTQHIQWDVGTFSGMFEATNTPKFDKKSEFFLAVFVATTSDVFDKKSGH